MLQDVPWWHWVGVVGAVLAAILGVVKLWEILVRDRPRVSVAVKRREFESVTSDPVRGSVSYDDQGEQGGRSYTSVYVDLLIQNRGKAATTLSDVTIETEDDLLGTLTLQSPPTNWQSGLLEPFPGCRMEANDSAQVSLEAVKNGFVPTETTSIKGTLRLIFGHKTMRKPVTIVRNMRRS